MPAAFEDLLRERDARLAAVDGLHRLVDVRTLPPRPARHREPERPLPAAVAAQVGPLYVHQARAIDLLRRDRSVVLSTGTASGKSLVHQVAVAEAVPGTALLLYPTKALARDQLRALDALALPGVVAASYDGDSSRAERSEARRSATALLTNPEMLHYGIVPNHPSWRRFLSGLRYVVIDELHTYRGTFGSHVAQLLRRLRRIAQHYGARPRFVCSSATLPSPGSFAEALCGVGFDVVDDDGAPCGSRTVAVWNPPLLDAAAGVRASAHVEAAGLLAELVRGGHRSIGFCPSRSLTELVARRTQARLGEEARVGVYRSGLLADERRAIEDELAAGSLGAVVATSALEVGVDLGELDACVVDGFPGTASSFWQQAGRTGRRAQESLVVLVCGHDQLDQWVAANPGVLHESGSERPVVNLANPAVADPHLRCAAFELPLTHHDEEFWPGVLDDCVRRLVHADDLIVRAAGDSASGAPAGGRGRARRRVVVDSPVAVWNGGGWPVDAVGLRGAAGGAVQIVLADGTPVGDVDAVAAATTVHPGASYTHAGHSYRVSSFDPATRTAVVEPDDGATFTRPRLRVDLRLLGREREDLLGSLRRAHGPLRVTTRVTGYCRFEGATGAPLDAGAVDLPPVSLETRGFWLEVPPAVLASAGAPRAAWGSVLHALEHVLVGVLPRDALCDRGDVAGFSTARHRDTRAPTVVIHDVGPGGSGIAELGFEHAPALLELAHEVVAACPCHNGCPSCVHLPGCAKGNEGLDKPGVARLLALLTADRDAAAI